MLFLLICLYGIGFGATCLLILEAVAKRMPADGRFLPTRRLQLRSAG